MYARRLLLSASLALVLTPSLAPASGADELPKRSREPGVRVWVAPTSPGGKGMSVTARDAQGMEHALRMESKDGKVIVHGEPDPARPWMGVLLSDPAELEALGSDLPSKAQRWTVTAVAAGSPAERGGLQRGDIITGVEGRDVLVDGPSMLKGREPGDRMTLAFERDGESMKANLTLAGHPGTVEFDDADGLGTFDLAGSMLGSMQGLDALESLKELRSLPCPPGTKPEDCPLALFALPSLSGPRLGVSVEMMTDQLARYFGAPEGHGLLVKDVVAGSPAEEAGIQAGDVILKVAGREIHAAGDIRAALESHEEGDRVTVDVLRRGKPVSVEVTLEAPVKTGSLGLPMMERQEALRQAELALAGAQGALSSKETRRAVEEAMTQAREAMREREVMRADVERARRDASGSFGRDAARELERALKGADVQVTHSEGAVIDL